MTARPYLRLLEPDPASPSVRPVEAAFRAHARYVHAIVYRIMGRAEDVEDVMQDLFIAAQRDLREIGHPSAVRRWFATAAIRLATRRLRRRRVFSLFRKDEHEYEDVAAPDASPEQRALLAAVYRVLDRVPVNARLAWSLRYIEGEPLEAVAEQCGCSLATAKRRIAAAQAIVEEAFK